MDNIKAQDMAMIDIELRALYIAMLRFGYKYVRQERYDDGSVTIHATHGFLRCFDLRPRDSDGQC